MLILFFLVFGSPVFMGFQTTPEDVKKALRKYNQVESKKPHGKDATKNAVHEWNFHMYNAEKNLYETVIKSPDYNSGTKKEGKWKKQVQYNYDDGEIRLFVDYYPEHDMYIIIKHYRISF